MLIPHHGILVSSISLLSGWPTFAHMSSEAQKPPLTYEASYGKKRDCASKSTPQSVILCQRPNIHHVCLNAPLQMRPSQVREKRLHQNGSMKRVGRQGSWQVISNSSRPSQGRSCISLQAWISGIAIVFLIRHSALLFVICG